MRWKVRAFGTYGTRMLHVLYSMLLIICHAENAHAIHATEVLVNTQVLGTIQYQGGFVEDATVEFSQPVVITTFSVEVPAFCRDVEVLETSYSGPRGQVRAVPVTGSRNNWSIPAGMPVTAIHVTINGPLDQSCTIPLMSTDDPFDPPTPGEPHPLDGLYTGTRSLRMDLSQGRVIRHNLIYQLPGVVNPSTIRFASIFVEDSITNGRWNARAYADQVLRSPSTLEWVVCRVPLALQILATPGAPHLYSFSLTGPATIGLDVFNRCFMTGSRIDTATIQRIQ